MPHRMWTMHAAEDKLKGGSRWGGVLVRAELDDGSFVEAKLTTAGALDLAAELVTAARDAHRTERRILTAERTTVTGTAR